MSLESIEQLMRLWEYERLKTEQVIGRILRLLQQHHERLLKLEAALSRLEPRSQSGPRSQSQPPQPPEQ